MNKLPALVMVFAAGCFIDPPAPCSNPEDGCVPPPVEEVVVLTTTPNLDLLFVVDDSPSMIEKQTAFRAALPALVEQLATLDGGVPNLHVAVASSDLGTSALDGQTGPSIGQAGNGGCVGGGKAGAFQLGGATLSNEVDNFLVQSRDGFRNFEGELATLIGQMSALGAGGCGFEQPLAATHVALSSSANAGFLRPGANLAVIVLSDEDDCSAEHPSLFGPESAGLGALQSFRCFRFGVECDQDTDSVGTKTNCRPAGSQHVTDPDPFAEALLATKQDARRVMFGGIVGTTGSVEVVMRAPNGGTPTPTVDAACRFTPASGGAELTADPAIRLTAFADNFAVSKVESICSADLAPATASLGATIVAMMNDTCVPAEFAEAECALDDHRDADPAYAQTIGACSQQTGVGANCFSFVADATCSSGQRLSIARPIPPHGDEWSTLRCRR